MYTIQMKSSNLSLANSDRSNVNIVCDSDHAFSAYAFSLWHCWLGGRKDIRPVKNWVVGCLACCVWIKVQICIWPSWCRCHSLSLGPVNPDWFYLPGAGSPG